MSIQQKYQSARSQLKNGDIILFSGKGFLAKLIQFFTKGKFNHVGIVWIAMNRVFILDSNSPGVHPDFLSARIDIYQDFEIVRLKREERLIGYAIWRLMDKSQEGTGIKYNFLRLLRIAIKDSFHIDLKYLDQKGCDICSQFVQIYCAFLNVKCFALVKLPLITPMDYNDRLDWNEGEILFR